MIEYKQALEIARSKKDNIDACDEFDIAWGFKCRKEQWNIGGKTPIYVLKENGAVVCQTDFFDNYDVEHIREFDVKWG